jgi:hypothetical protein
MQLHCLNDTWSHIDRLMDFLDIYP